MRPFRRAFRAMGSPCQVQLYGESEVDVEAAARAALAEVERLEGKYSRYRDDSVVTAINRSAGDPAGICVDSETTALLDYAETAHAQSGGLFDVTSGILRRAWNHKSGRIPGQEEIAPLLERVGWRKVRWRRPRLVLPLSGMELDFGGYVKEYAADRVAELCRRRGVRFGMVDLGGDIAVVGPHPDGSPWRIGTRDPANPEHALTSLSLEQGAVATSGDYERFILHEGKRYSHILDPRTGWPVDGMASVSVAASHCLLAGTVSTIAMLKGTRDGVRWLEEVGLPHVRVGADGRVAGTLARPPAAAR